MAAWVATAAMATPPVAAANESTWVGLASARHSAQFAACAQTDGGPCAPHSNITLLDPAQHGWWNGSTTGDEICDNLGLPKCSRMLAFDCHKKLSCSAPMATNSTPQGCGGSNPGHTFCESDLSPGQCDSVGPTTCPPVDSMALAAQALTLCGSQRGTKKCLACTGECEECKPPWTPPKPGTQVLPGMKGCTSPLAKSMPYCDTSKSIDERVDWIVANMTLVEKIRAISPQPDLGNTW
eukprot:COSAG02_NODE_4249_length_5586_cov_14.082377_8_plen_238_part_00